MQVLHVNAALCGDSDGLHPHAGHLGAGGVGAVGANGDEADLPVDITAGLVVTLDGTQPGILSLGTAGITITSSWMSTDYRSQCK